MQCQYIQIKTNSLTGREYHHPCGQCMACRIRYKQTWASRILIESQYHAASIFITLTYDDDHYPANGQLNKKVLQDWLKRYRFAIGERRIRYYACGEYGERSGRPHYHAVIFGADVSDEEIICQTWNQGYVQVSDLTPARAEYVAKYTTKVLTSESSSQDGHVKEFSLMSRRPGIGSQLVEKLVEASRKHGFALSSFHTYESPENQTPTIFQDSFRMNGRLYPIGRYLKTKLKTEGFNHDLYMQSLESKAIDTSGGSVFEEVLRRADAVIESRKKLKLLRQKRRMRSQI